jgi:hypothetical protein
MRKIEFIKPSMEIDNEFISDKNYCKLRITPLERGYGQTIGNSMRRVLLSSLPGAAAVAIAIEGVDHEFTPVDGVIEDVTEIILNVKNIVSISIIGLWTASVLAFVILWILGHKLWIIFPATTPVMFVVWLVLNSIFFRGKNNMWLTHCLLLSVFAVVYFIFGPEIWPLVFVAIPLHTIVFLSFHIKKRRNSK